MRRPRFSLRTLLILVCLTGSGFGLWWRWEPWTLAYSMGYESIPKSLMFSSDGKSLLWVNRPLDHRSINEAPVNPFAGEGSPIIINLTVIDSATGSEKWATTSLEMSRRETVAWTNDGNWIYQTAFVSHGSSWIRSIWNAHSGKIVYDAARMFEENEHHLIALSSSGNWAAKISRDQTTLVVSNLQSGHEVQLQNTPEWFQHVTFSPNGTQLAATCIENEKSTHSHLRIWNLATGQLKHLLREVPISDNTFPMFSPNGQIIAVEGAKNAYETIAFSTDSGEKICRVKGVPQIISESGRYLITGNVIENKNESLVNFIWEIQTGKLVARIKMLGLNSYNRFSPDERYLYSVRSECIIFRELAGEKELFSVPTQAYRKGLPFGGNAPSFDWTQDSKRALISEGKTPALFDMENGNRLSFCEKFVTIDTRSTIAPDGEFAAIGGHGPYSGIWHRRRPEYWWGVAWLWEFWVSVLFSLALVASLWLDWRYLGIGKA